MRLNFLPVIILLLQTVFGYSWALDSNSFLPKVSWAGSVQPQKCAIHDTFFMKLGCPPASCLSPISFSLAEKMVFCIYIIEVPEIRKAVTKNLYRTCLMVVLLFHSMSARTPVPSQVWPYWVLFSSSASFLWKFFSATCVFYLNTAFVDGLQPHNPLFGGETWVSSESVPLEVGRWLSWVSTPPPHPSSPKTLELVSEISLRNADRTPKDSDPAPERCSFPRGDSRVVRIWI